MSEYFEGNWNFSVISDGWIPVAGSGRVVRLLIEGATQGAGNYDHTNLAVNQIVAVDGPFWFIKLDLGDDVVALAPRNWQPIAYRVETSFQRPPGFIRTLIADEVLLRRRGYPGDLIVQCTDLDPTWNNPNPRVPQLEFTITDPTPYL